MKRAPLRILIIGSGYSMPFESVADAADTLKVPRTQIRRSLKKDSGFVIDGCVYFADYILGVKTDEPSRIAVCQWCGKPFEKHGLWKCCSPECARKAHLKRMLEYSRKRRKANET